jgi:hypothetical protein
MLQGFHAQHKFPFLGFCRPLFLRIRFIHVLAPLALLALPEQRTVVIDACAVDPKNLSLTFDLLM